jgi:hypothetical protein
LIFFFFFLSSCASNFTVIIPVPPDEYFFQQEKITIKINNIIETKNGSSIENLPIWFATFINGGIEEVEKIDAFYGKYVFIGFSEGINPGALEIWTDKFSTVQDFIMLAAERIQRRMLSGISLYPDDEYGEFFEKFIKRAYGTVYPDAVKEDTYWIKSKINNEEITFEPTDVSASSHIYNYFVLIVIDKTIMQTVINKMMEEIYSSVTPAGSQRNSIIRLRQNFFEGF